ncbi:NADPH-dependent FMN reductase, partial [Streptomyces sp. SID7803]|nr:NADPH-dependent FMN reductase [Streptomyces sp. SID7803]
MDLITAESTATAMTEDAPLKVAVILASNREGRFAPVIADWFLAHADGHPAIETEVVD